MILSFQQAGKKMGFWSVASLVAGSQIGSGIFLLPAGLAAFGAAGLTSWLITGGGALLLALIFAGLCAHSRKPGDLTLILKRLLEKRSLFLPLGLIGSFLG